MLNPSVAHCWVYKYMLETEYGVRVSAMYLAQVHPCLPRARLIEVPCMRDELQLVVEDQIGRGEAISGALPDATFALPTLKIRSTDCARMRARPFQPALCCNRSVMSLSCSLSCHPIPFFFPSRFASLRSLGSRWKDTRTQSSSFLACRMPPGGF